MIDGLQEKCVTIARALGGIYIFFISTQSIIYYIRIYKLCNKWEFVSDFCVAFGIIPAGVKGLDGIICVFVVM